MEGIRIEAVRERHSRTKASIITSPIGCGGNTRSPIILLALGAEKEKKMTPLMPPMTFKGKQWSSRILFPFFSMGLGMMLLFANKFVTESHRSSHNITAVPVQILMGATKIGGKLSQKSIMPDVMLELCEVDVFPYHSQPEKYPFLQNIITELCGEQDITYRLASELAKNESAGRKLEPSGFIFHEGHVGSTLVANMLASIPTNLVYPEPRVVVAMMRQCDRRTVEYNPHIFITTAILFCSRCTEEEAVHLLRMIILAMGRSHHHDYFFIKFQTQFIPFMPYVLKAFPEIPWIFIHRNPVEVMVSNLKTKKGSDCLRGGPTKEIQTMLATDKAGAMAASDEDKCAAQLAVLCETAVKHLLPNETLGRTVSYTTLVEEITEKIIPHHFGVNLSKTDLTRMLRISSTYSKNGNKPSSTLFQSDAVKKQESANKAIKAAADKYLKRPMALLHEIGERPHPNFY